ncbi:TPA: hypothetical protein ACTW1J_000873 [Raoultella planticola]
MKGMRISACPDTDRRRTRSRRPGQRRREAVGFPDTAPDTPVRSPTASVRVPVASVSAQRRREAVGFPDTAPDTPVRSPTASVRVPVAPVSAAPLGGRGIPGHGA